MKPGLNPALRGYSPSKPYWKQGTVPAKPTRPASQSLQMGGQPGLGTPNTYTRVTKHTPGAK